MSVDLSAATKPIEALQAHYTNKLTTAVGDRQEAVLEVIKDIYNVAVTAMTGEIPGESDTSETSRGFSARSQNEFEDLTVAAGKVALICTILGVEMDALPKLNANAS